MPKSSASFGENTDTVASPSTLDSCDCCSLSKISRGIRRIVCQLRIQRGIGPEVQKKPRTNSKRRFIKLVQVDAGELDTQFRCIGKIQRESEDEWRGCDHSNQ